MVNDFINIEKDPKDKNEISLKKNAIYKEKLFNELKKNNSLTQKKTILDAENFMNINNHGNLNEKFLRQMIKMKKLEFKIFQNIFNLFYYEYDILKYKELFFFNSLNNFSL